MKTGRRDLTEQFRKPILPWPQISTLTACRKTSPRSSMTVDPIGFTVLTSSFSSDPVAQRRLW